MSSFLKPMRRKAAFNVFSDMQRATDRTDGNRNLHWPVSLRSSLSILIQLRDLLRYALEVASQDQALTSVADRQLRATYAKLTPWQKTQVARHPELIGVSGALRGSSGLKDPEDASAPQRTQQR